MQKKISSNELIVNGTIRSEELRILGLYGNHNIALSLKAGTYYLKTVGDLKCNSYEIGYMDGSAYKYQTIKNNGQIKLNNNGGLTTIKCNVTLGMTYTNASICFMISNDISSYEPYHEQTVTLPYTLNAIPVESGGNVTIDGQQYIADYVDVERGKLVRKVDSSKLDNTQSIVDKTEWLLAEQQEVSLTDEEIQTFKALATYYPVTNISVNSKQLDGYTVFNYPISMKNGWNYVKQQLNDNRDYIYDMDLQSAEAYVNSEYAVALTELEV